MKATAPKRLDIFWNHVFADGIEAVEGRFVPGRHIDDWANWITSNRKTCLISARKHLKSTRFYAKIAWRLFNILADPESAPRFYEGMLISFSDDMSQYHMAKAKRYIESNQWFKKLVPLTDAKSIMHYATTKDREHPAYREVLFIPAGIMTFKRGWHGDEVICDDILQDPERKLDLTQLFKITDIFFEQVVSMPKEGGELHVAGTPQDKEDIFNEIRKRGGFAFREQPCWSEEKEGAELWPEMFPLPRLQQIRDEELGKKSFMKEMLCRPVREVSGYFEEAELEAVTDKTLVPFKVGMDCPNVLVAGLDLGKKTHPSHFVLFKEEGDELIQLQDIWWERTDYTDQVEYIKTIDKMYDLRAFWYDDTRAELEGFKEREELPVNATGLPFGTKSKHESAATFGRRVRKKKIRLLPGARQRRQILAVDDNLDAPATQDGHGDSFWSVALACRAADSVHGGAAAGIDWNINPPR